MLRIISANLNGIRSASTKGFFEWLSQQNADLVCVQELKAQESDLSEEMRNPGQLRGYFHCAEKKGYSGVGIYTRHQSPLSVQVGLGIEEFDREGRYLALEFPSLTVVSLYLPSGSASPERQAAKFRFLEAFEPHLQALIASGKPYVICGDWNIAHKEIDLKNWKSNQKNSGFLPEERAFVDRVLAQGWVDVFRQLDSRPERYTWWSNRGQAWAKNVGWRIDYQLATPDWGARASASSIWVESRFSDHAPLVIDYTGELV